MPDPSQLDVEHIGDVTVVRFVGTKILDERSVQDAGEQLYRLVDELGTRKVLLSFRNVEYLSSALLGKLITLNKMLNAVGGRLRLCNLDPQIVEVFEITKLNKLFIIDRDEEEGLAGVGARLKPPKPSDQNSAALRLPRPDQE